MCEKESTVDVHSIEFLEEYSLKGRTAREIQKDLKIKDSWYEHVVKALHYLKKTGNMQGIYLVNQVDQYVMEQENYDEWIKEFDQ